MDKASPQRVVVIQDASSEEVSSSAAKWALDGLSLKPGDELTILGVLHLVNNPLGYKSRVDSKSLLGPNREIIIREAARKMQEYQNSNDIIQISELYETNKVKFSIEVTAGPLKEIALETARNLQATWVILDRKMKKDKKYFLEKLSCGISRIKRDNCIEELRGPKAKGKFQVAHDKLIPGTPKEEDLFSLEFTPTKSLNPGLITIEEEQGDDSIGLAGSKYTKSTKFSTSVLSQENTRVSGSVAQEAGHVHCHEEQNKSKARGKIVEDKSTGAVLDNQEVSQTGTVQKKEEKELTQSNMSQPNHTEQVGCGGTRSITASTEDVIEVQQSQGVFDHLVCSTCKNRRPEKGYKMEFSYAELLDATNGFSAKNLLSEGGLGPVFRGQIKNMVNIAVKQHRDTKYQEEDEFKFEVHLFSKVNHENVVKLLGSCSEASHRFLVYEYACNGSLNEHLSQTKLTPLTWMLRVKIAMDASRGLNYLHHNNIIHRDIRATNILLTHDHETLLGDFGITRPPFGSDQCSEHRADRSFEYSAPEYIETEKASKETDVYSFGVVLLELITGRVATDKIFEGTSLVEWARPLCDERKHKVLIDPRIVDSHDASQLCWMVRVAEKCLRRDPKKRSSMNSVFSSLKRIMEGKIAQSCLVESFPESQKSTEHVRQ